MKYLYLLIVLFCTNFLVQANPNYLKLNQEEIQSSTDSIVCDIVINGTSVPNFTPTVLAYTVSIPYGSAIPNVEMILCDSTTVLNSLVIEDALSVPGTTILTIETGIGDAVYYINWIYDLPSSIATLDSLYTDTGFFCLPFYPMEWEVDAFSISLEVGSWFTSLVNLIVVPTDINSTYQITGSGTVAPLGDILITVTAQDGITSNIYVVHVMDYCPLGIEEYGMDPIEILPNPATSSLEVHFNIEQGTKLFLVDLSGRKLTSFDLSQGQKDYQFDISDFPSGIYFLQVLLEGGEVLSEKLIIK